MPASKAWDPEEWAACRAAAEAAAAAAAVAAAAAAEAAAAVKAKLEDDAAAAVGVKAEAGTAPKAEEAAPQATGPLPMPPQLQTDGGTSATPPVPDAPLASGLTAGSAPPLAAIKAEPEPSSAAAAADTPAAASVSMPAAIAEAPAHTIAAAAAGKGVLPPALQAVAGPSGADAGEAPRPDGADSAATSGPAAIKTERKAKTVTFREKLRQCMLLERERLAFGKSGECVSLVDALERRGWRSGSRVCFPGWVEGRKQAGRGAASICRTWGECAVRPWGLYLVNLFLLPPPPSWWLRSNKLVSPPCPPPPNRRRARLGHLCSPRHPAGHPRVRIQGRLGAVCGGGPARGAVPRRGPRLLPLPPK